MAFPRLRQSLSLILLISANFALAQHMHENADARAHLREAAPLLEGIGNLHHAVSTKDPLAQRLFDQGLIMDYGFNHMESERSFRYAAQIDPKLAIAWWGVALANGSNLNSPIDAEREKTAYEAIQKAVALKQNASPGEQALIDALAQRYTNDPKPDFAKLEQAYSDAMEKIAKQYSDDPDVRTLYVDAIMNTMPWDYYEENGQPKAGTAKGIAELEQIMKRWPEHPGANHLYIHIVEASSTPERAVGAAERLGPFAPNAGHLVHMPSHIWVRVGRWEDAVNANVEASKADEEYIAQCHRQGRYPLGYYPHNLHMLTFASMMEGRSSLALQSAQRAANQMPEDWQEHPPSYAVGFEVLPYFAAARFGRWDEILATPAPLDQKGFVQGMWHYARGMAFARRQQFEKADMELDAIDEILRTGDLTDYKARKNGSVPTLEIARYVLAGETASERKEYQRAEALLRKAVYFQDHLEYDEPEDWYYGVRLSLGNVLLKGNRPTEAQAEFEQDLVKHPENGWALFGLAQSLREQGKTAEADAVDARFKKAWARADVKLTAALY